ncbi:hypothetical protein ACFY12_28420 [Streptomyces sp. NPDC001339]|uniref:hypothetical protein n=1 Tax=Streptomyces sp. NPDC001339 TaxID=3364563 RepID=UPI003685CA7B
MPPAGPERQRTMTPPVHLGVPKPDPEPAPGCDVCGALARQREDAQRSGDMSMASDLNIEMRNHPHRRRT